MNSSLVTGVIFLDFKKAFDLVDHGILLKKLQHYLNIDTTNSIFQSYLTNRTQKVLLNGTYSALKNISLGVPQGSILGPLLFSIYINDLPLHLNNQGVECDLFADDTSIHGADKEIATVSKSLQNALDAVSEWCKTNSMIIHPVKTKSMVIATRQKHQIEPLLLKLNLDGNPIEQVIEHRLLGVTIDNQLRWQTHITNVCKNVSKNLFMLARLKPYIDAGHVL